MSVNTAEYVKAETLFVLQKLTEASLEQVCATQNITVNTGKKCRKVALKNALVRFMSSETLEDSDDEGLSVFTAILEQAKSFLREEGVVEDDEDKITPTTSITTGHQHSLQNTNNNDTSTSSLIDQNERQLKREMENQNQQHPVRIDGIDGIHLPNLNHQNQGFSRIKLKEFKVSGTVGGADGLDWNSLNYQIQREGLDLGYSPREIMSGVIRATKSGSTLRKYFEGKTSLDWETFTRVLKTHCSVKTAQNLCDQMRDSAQEPTEDTHDYIMRMCNLKDVIMDTSKGEPYPMRTPEIREKFERAVDIGLRSPTTRLELKPLIYNKDLHETDMLEEAKKLLTIKEENEKKSGKTKRNAGVHKVEVDSVQEKLLTQMTTLTEIVVENQRHMKDLEKQMSEFKNKNKNQERNQERNQDKDQDRNQNRNGGRNQDRKKEFYMKCAPCERERLFCTHCAKCGEEGHKQKMCPKNSK